MVRDRKSRTPKYVSVRDFDRLQLRKGTPLPWIKLYIELLDDYVFQHLPDNTKFHFIGLNLLAMRMGNRLPNDPDYLARKIGANTPIDTAFLLSKKLLIPCKRLMTKGRANTLNARTEQSS